METSAARSSGAPFFPKQESVATNYQYCCVCEKSNSSYKHRYLMFHEFPVEGTMIKIEDPDGNFVFKDKRQLWYEKTQVSTNLRHPVICSSHFRQVDYILPGVKYQHRRVLKNLAVPSVNLPKPRITLLVHSKQKDKHHAKLQRTYQFQGRKGVTEEKKNSVQKNIFTPIICNPILFAPIFNEIWRNAHKIILPNERWSFCKLETTKCGRELVFSEIMYDEENEVRSTKKQVVLSCQKGFKYFIHSEKMTSEQISTRINENVFAIESLQFLLCEVDKAQVSNCVFKRPHHVNYQDKIEKSKTVEESDKMPSFELVQTEDVALQETKKLKQISDPFAREKCSVTQKVYGNKVSLKMKNSKLDKLSLKSNEIQDSRNDQSRVLPIESVFIKEEKIDYQNETIDSEQLMFIKEEEPCDMIEFHENDS